MEHDLILVEPGLFRKECKTAYRRMLRDNNIHEKVNWIKGWRETLKHFKYNFQFIPDRIEKGDLPLEYRIFLDGLEFLHCPYQDAEKYILFTRTGQIGIYNEHRITLGRLLEEDVVY